MILKSENEVKSFMEIKFLALLLETFQFSKVYENEGETLREEKFEKFERGIRGQKCVKLQEKLV